MFVQSLAPSGTFQTLGVALDISGYDNYWIVKSIWLFVVCKWADSFHRASVMQAYWFGNCHILDLFKLCDQIGHTLNWLGGRSVTSFDAEWGQCLVIVLPRVLLWLLAFLIGTLNERLGILSPLKLCSWETVCTMSLKRLWANHS